MKLYPYILLSLSLLSVTVQASSKSPYIEEQKEDFQQWKDLYPNQIEQFKAPLDKLYQHSIARHIAHIKKKLPVHFVVSSTGQGKSTLIYALQGNKITRVEEEEEKEINKTIDTGKLILTKTISQDLATPTVKEGIDSVTNGATIYYTGQKTFRNIPIPSPMAFCDTQAIIISRKKGECTPYEAKVYAYAPYFVLQNNTIQSILVLVDSTTINTSTHLEYHIDKIHKKYLNIAVTPANRQALKQHIKLIVNVRYEKINKKVSTLVRNIKDSYTHYYKTLKDMTEKERKGHPKHFYSLLLKKEVTKEKIKNITIASLDRNNTIFYAPHNHKSVDELRNKLAKIPSPMEFSQEQKNHYQQKMAQIRGPIIVQPKKPLTNSENVPTPKEVQGPHSEEPPTPPSTQEEIQPSHPKDTTTPPPGQQPPTTSTPHQDPVQEPTQEGNPPTSVEDDTSTPNHPPQPPKAPTQDQSDLQNHQDAHTTPPLNSNNDKSNPNATDLVLPALGIVACIGLVGIVKYTTSSRPNTKKKKQAKKT